MRSYDDVNDSVFDAELNVAVKFRDEKFVVRAAPRKAAPAPATAPAPAASATDPAPAAAPATATAPNTRIRTATTAASNAEPQGRGVGAGREDAAPAPAPDRRDNGEVKKTSPTSESDSPGSKNYETMPGSDIWGKLLSIFDVDIRSEDSNGNNLLFYNINQQAIMFGEEKDNVASGLWLRIKNVLEKHPMAAVKTSLRLVQKQILTMEVRAVVESIIGEGDDLQPDVAMVVAIIIVLQHHGAHDTVEDGGGNLEVEDAAVASNSDTRSVDADDSRRYEEHRVGCDAEESKATYTIDDKLSQIWNTLNEDDKAEFEQDKDLMEKVATMNLKELSMFVQMCNTGRWPPGSGRSPARA